MSDPSVTERRIRPIQDAIATSSWKQALQACDKWTKKGEKSDRFLALRAFVLVSHPEPVHHVRGRAEVENLCKRNPPITNPEAIYQLQDALKALGMEAEGEGMKLWERAAVAKPNDKDLLMRWINQAIYSSDWHSAQKAAMGLRKSFPKDRNYEFWNIAMCYLISVQSGVPEKDRMLFGTLAYRMITKAVEAIPPGQDRVIAPGKELATPEEVSLLVQILNSTGRPQESVKLLQSASLNTKSAIGKQDSQLIALLLAQSLEQSQQWEEAFSYCHGLLSSSQYSRNDDQVWGLYLTALSNLPSESFRPKAKEMLDFACTERAFSRSAHMAMMKFLSGEQGDDHLEDLLRTCLKYGCNFSDKAFCFDDMKIALRRLDKNRLDTFSESLLSPTDILKDLFNLKVDYSFLSADAGEQQLIDSARRTLLLFKRAQETSQPCQEAAFLAALAILRLSMKKNSNELGLFALALLETGRTKSGDYYLFTILVVHLQVHFGLMSLAMKTFLRLSVKNMQWESVGHLFLTRISTLHPAPSGAGEEAFDPSHAVGIGLTILENADNALVRGIREGLSHGSYSNIHNSVTVRSQIEHSMNRQLFMIEERKLARQLGIPQDTMLPPCPSHLVDKRDFSYLPSYRDDDPELLQRFRCGPLPKERWITAMAAFENVATYLEAQLTSQSTLLAKVSETLNGALTQLDSVSNDLENSDLTKQEISNLTCYKLLAQAVIFIRDGSAKLDQWNDVLSQLDRWLSKTLEQRKTHPSGFSVSDVRLPSWEDLHNSLSQLETLKAIAMLLGVLSKTSSKGAKGKVAASPSKESLGDVRERVSELEKQIHDDARDLKEQVTAAGVLGKLVDVGLGREGVPSELGSIMQELCEESWMENYCGNMKESWEDAVNGVLAVKVKVYS
ncbi:uncharacterized protein PV06_06173 [Exophiala oligosperma]|uniref:Uncharacterized protein n=2 Tax=Chaetothyriales TaxID=34395 RepID=A0A0D2E4C1_9EURO|nr:uncharacterized protein PV06_06173 [Exophiala oligosperma]KAJ9633532.1 hypothetical protein H2204_006915 [Knufia peltigerae]KIW42644.1 hypothetical protein PV06_06173 [Exophiala oligosperma]